MAPRPVEGGAHNGHRVAEKSTGMPDGAVDVLQRKLALKKPEHRDVGTRPDPERPHLMFESEYRGRPRGRSRDHLA
jgi:hypothetical protein